MKTVFHRILVVVCALYLSGVHWAILQTTAWTGMLVVRTQEAGVVRAVKSTFDGAHPCSLCVVIKEAQREDQKGESKIPVLKKLMETNFIAIEENDLPVRSEGDSMCWVEFSENGLLRADAPLTPPPLA